MAKGRKFGFVNRTREAVDRVGLALPLPNVNPNVLSGISIITSFAFLALFKFSIILSFLFLIITLLLDWFDGLVAKKFFRTSEEGYLADLTSDRLSEGVMFVIFFPWFCVFVINCALSIFSVKRNKHVIIPARHFFVIFILWLILA